MRARMLAGAMAGAERSSAQIMNIMLMKDQLGKKIEDDKLDRKIKDLQIKKAESELEQAHQQATMEKQLWDEARDGLITSALNPSGQQPQEGPGTEQRLMLPGMPEGGFVGAGAGSRAEDGVIYDAQGNMAGEYLPGYGPKEATVSPQRAGLIANMGEGGMATPDTAQAPQSTMSRIQDRLPPGSSYKVGNITIKASRQENPKDELTRKAVEGTLTEQEQGVFDRLTERTGTVQQKILRIVADQGVEALTAGQKDIYDNIIKKGDAEEDDDSLTGLLERTKAQGEPQKKQAQGNYKAGDTRVFNGKTYVRGNDGKWIPKNR